MFVLFLVFFLLIILVPVPFYHNNVRFTNLYTEFIVIILLYEM